MLPESGILAFYRGNTFLKQYGSDLSVEEKQSGL